MDRPTQANNVTIVDLLPQLPPLLSVTDTAIAGPSQPKPDNEKTGDCSSYASHGQCNASRGQIDVQ